MRLDEGKDRSKKNEKKTEKLSVPLRGWRSFMPSACQSLVNRRPPRERATGPKDLAPVSAVVPENRGTMLNSVLRRLESIVAETGRWSA